MRSESVCLPHEDRDWIMGTFQRWGEFYDPQSPAAEHLLETCVHATIRIYPRPHRERG